MYVVFRRGMSCSPAAAERYLRAAYLLVAYISCLRIRAQKCYSRRKKPSAARFVMKNRANAYNRGKTARGKRIKTRHARPFARRAEVFTFIYLPLPAIFAIIIWQKSEKCRFICRPRLSGAKKLSICAEEGTAIRGLHFRIRINTFFFTDIPLSEIRWRSLWKGRSFSLPATSPFWRYS